MDWPAIVSAVIVILVILNIFQASKIRREVARVDAKLGLLIKHLNVPVNELSGLSERVMELARNPHQKIEAIKVQRDETGCSLAEAKATVEAYMDSIGR